MCAKNESLKSASEDPNGILLLQYSMDREGFILTSKAQNAQVLPPVVQSHKKRKEKAVLYRVL